MPNKKRQHSSENSKQLWIRVSRLPEVVLPENPEKVNSCRSGSKDRLLKVQGTPFSFFIQWHVTEACNLRCRHCYQRNKISELSFTRTCEGIFNIHSSIMRWVEDYSLKMSPSIHFTGGEPLLRKDLFQIIDYARSLGLAVSLMSNGTLITVDTAGQIRESGITDVQISIDGLEEVHDSIRGKGAFQKAIKGIKNLLSQGVDTNINLTLTRINANELKGIMHLSSVLGVSSVSISRLVPCGNGNALIDEMLTASELADIYNNLHKYSGKDNISLISSDPLSIVSNLKKTIEYVNFPVGGCAAAMFGITITSNGDIMPCRRMDMSIGNVREQSFRKIWAESEVLWSLRNREAYHGKCGKCIYWSVCRGCRAIVLALSRNKGGNDYLGDDPQCSFYKSRE